MALENFEWMIFFFMLRYLVSGLKCNLLQISYPSSWCTPFELASIFHFRCRLRINVSWDTVVFVSKAYLCDSVFCFLFLFSFFIKLLRLCSYRWRFVIKDKDGGYQRSRWQFAATYPCHHDNHLVWEEAEFEGEKIVFRKPTVRNKNVMSELYV